MAQRLSISEATIFTYFGSKRELCMEMLKGWYDEMSTELEQEVPLINGIRVQLHFVIRKHLKHLIEDGTGLCALVLSEGRNVDEEFMILIADLKRRYTAPLMRVLSAAKESGEIRSDIPLRLMRDMVYGSMEHILWGRIVTGRMPDIDLTALQLADLLWSAFIPSNKSVEALMQFRAEVADALQRVKESDT
jgi:AcrR family transcriptional regulator